MNTDTFFQLLQQSFRIGVGATASLLETLQDPHKRSETLSILQTQMSEKTQEWAEKGEITEQEARRLVDQWLNQSNRPSNPNQSSSSSTETPGNIDSEIQQLTEQVIALRQELEELREK
ncbi:hypothetical protein [Crocosphaera sp. XPORK-15E]|uniref:hypothetical protein n=1 Tax=Crocosphaera sp. XPORK-15E TaxID=3110247 RepID=UPI002B1EE89C|nr:hypothetical protein [Crocosphaera sp. XPORK-15E]MEA5532883.1 hypothetical protein [Crocosphaera sp. XPORK-15E]